MKLKLSLKLLIIQYLGLILCCLLLSCGNQIENPTKAENIKSNVKDLPQKIVLLGFDGVDPVLLEKMLSEDKLPNLKRLSEQGTYCRLLSENPPQSPVAWTTFSTGTNPGKHGIYDFLVRDPKTYFPDVSTSGVKNPEFDASGKIISLPEGINKRTGQSFWNVVSEAGIPVEILSIPYNFPPDQLAHGEMLSALGTPDLRGTNSSFSFYATDLEKEKESVAGGRLYKIKLSENGEVNTYIEGPRDFTVKGGKSIEIPLKISLNKENKTINIDLQGVQQSVPEGRFSDWFTLRFEATKYFSIAGIAKFYVVQVSPELQLYLSPLNIHPIEPYIPISYPKDFSAQLAKNFGFFKTVGWSEDTSALNSEKVSERMFIEDCYQVMDFQRKMILDRIGKGNWNLLISAWTATDRIAHMFWRLTEADHPRYDDLLAREYRDAIFGCYKEMDKIVGEVWDHLPPNTDFMIFSDHGFHSFKWGVNVNTWLVRNGFMSLKDQGDLTGEKIPDNLFTEEDFFAKVDWSRTKAYSMGTGQIYVNLTGREKNGIVSPGAEYDEVVKAIANGLKTALDPNTKETFTTNVYIGKEVYSGGRITDAPDLIPAFKPGYRASWATGLGGIPPQMIEPNTKKWSGDHASSDVNETKGIFFYLGKISTQNPAIVDLAPSILNYFGLPIPSYMDGKPFLEPPKFNQSSQDSQ